MSVHESTADAVDDFETPAVAVLVHESTAGAAGVNELNAGVVCVCVCVCVCV